MAIVDNYTKDELIEKFEQSNSFAQFILSLGYKTSSGSNNITVKKRLDAYNIDYSKFYQFKAPPIKRNEENVFIKDSTASQQTLRRWYKKGNYTKYKCSICNQEPIWNGKELTLILDHINGNSRDDRLGNLRWVCPNCNQQLETTGFKKMRSKGITKNFCLDCGKEINKESSRCVECNNKKLRFIKNRPSRKELKQLIRNMPFTKIGEKFGVSDNAIRKWCDAENLPRSARKIASYSDEEWLLI